jgi:hypothetical protein
VFRVVNGVHLPQQRQQRVVEDFLDLRGAADVDGQVRRLAQALFGVAVERLAQTARLRLTVARCDVQPRRVAGADAGVDAGAGPRGRLQLGEQLVRCRVAVAPERIDEAVPVH